MISLWQCKLGGTASAPPEFDALARDLLRALYVNLTGAEPDLVTSGWDGELTATERRILHDRYPDTPEYQ